MLKSKLGDRISITKFSLDSASPPIVNNITAVPYSRTGMKDRGVVLKVPLRLCLMDANSATVEVTYGPVKVGLDRLNIRGNLLIYVRPLLGRVPFIGGMECTFENKPQVEVDFSGIGG